MKDHFEERIKKIRSRLKDSDTGAMLVFKEENIYYFTGFHAKDSGSILIITGKEIFLIVHFIYFEQAKKTVGVKGLNLIEFTANRFEKFLEITGSIGEKIFGIESNFVPYDTYIKYEEALNKKGKKLKNFPHLIEGLRIIKDEFELSMIKESCKITDAVIKNIIEMDFKKITRFTEIGLSVCLEEMMIEMNATSKSFDLVVANNEAASFPHYRPSQNKIRQGPILLDIGCVFANYCSDITRTLFLKNKPNRKIVYPENKNDNNWSEIYDIVLQAQMAALQKCRAGIACSDIDAVARNIIRRKGYGKYFGHGLGHGVGLEIHEAPKLSYTDNTVLEENMVITIEPGIYIEGKTGVRIEDMVIVKKNGCINLYSSPKTITIIGQ